MATTTNLSQVNGTAYTWDNQALLWSDALAALRSWEGSYSTIAYTMSVGEDIVVGEALSKNASIAKSEAFAVVETRELIIGLNQSEAVAFAEARAFAFSQSLSEMLSVGDGCGNFVTKPLSESFAVSESNAKSFELNKSESFAFAESTDRSVGWIRNFAETFAVAESVAKTYGLKPSEAFQMVDSWRRAADMVISDIIFGTGDLDIESFKDFMSYGSAPGYTDWRDFVPGDYEYQEALFRAVIESKNSDRGLLTGFEVAVDVPDLIDRGSATIVDANAGITITFMRDFHVVPEITLSTKGGVAGTTLTPELVSATKTNCVVKMKNQAGAYATGSFTWAAHGY